MPTPTTPPADALFRHRVFAAFWFAPIASGFGFQMLSVAIGWQIYAITINTSNQLGEFESGMLAAWLGAVNATVFGGIGTLLVVGFWMAMFPGLRRRQRLQL